jgi:hypothetical protein
MKTPLILGLLSGWSYEGFIADPPISSPNPSAISTSTEQPASIPAQAPQEGARARWRLADSSGQSWEHEDLDWLRRWVAIRNHLLSSTQRTSLPESWKAGG